MIENAVDIDVVVIVALPDHVTEVALRLPAGSTIADALERSLLAARHPDFDPMRAPVGIFGKVADHTTILADGDRVEVYRSLIADPKEGRLRRAAARHKRRPQ